MANTTEGTVQIADAGTSPEANQKLYNDWASKYEEDVRSWGYNMPEVCAEKLKLHAPVGSEAVFKVLDAGAGDGLSGKALADQGFKEVIGIDLSTELVKIANDKKIYKHAEVGDLSRPLKYETDEFDAITVVGVMTYLEPDGCSLSEFCRVVKPGGLILMTHRTDKIAMWTAVQEQFEKTGSWEKVEISQPLPYLPNNPEYADDIKVTVHIYRVGTKDSVDQKENICGIVNAIDHDKAEAVHVPWGHQPDASTFNPKYATEFRESQIPFCGNGWYAKQDIPAGVRMRRISTEEGSLIRIGSEEEFKATGWDPDEAVNYGIGHHMDPAAIYFLYPGTAVNHADPSREASVEYRHCEPGVMEIWTTKDIKAGDEIYCDYEKDYAPCAWYDKLQNKRGNVPLSQIPRHINSSYLATSFVTPQPQPAPQGFTVFKQQGTLGKEKTDKKDTAVPIPWGRPPNASSFNPEYATEFRESQIPFCGKGWYAKQDIPAGVRMRRISTEQGSLIRIGSEEEFKATGWDPDEAVNYGIGHHMDPAAIYYLNPGTPVNHADPSREASAEYRHCEPGVMEIWTTKDIRAGEEMYCDYEKDYAPCTWYDKLQNERGNVPLSQIPMHVNKLYAS